MASRTEKPLGGVRITQMPEVGVDAAALEGALRQVLEGEVRFDVGTRALYVSDASSFREPPIGVVIPKNSADVEKAIALCRRFGAPITNRGGGTSLAGQTCNFAVVIDFSKYLNRVLALDPDRRLAQVQPGTILDDLRNQAERHHLTFGPDPATHSRCTLGGMIGNNSCGVHAQMAGKTSDNIESLDVLLYDGTRMTLKSRYSDDEIEQLIQAGGRQGEIFARLRALRDRYGETIRRETRPIPRNISGYGLYYLLPEHGFNVAAALVGTEGTCVTILEASCRLVDSPPVKSLLVLGYSDIATACDHLPEVLACDPMALEGMDDLLIDYLKRKHLHTEHLNMLPRGRGWLMVQFGGRNREEADSAALKLKEILERQPDPPDVGLFDVREKEAMLWEIRESAVGATAMVPGMADTWPGWEDSAVPPEKLGDYLRDLRRLMEAHGYHGAFYGHFGQGCVHCRIDFDLKTAAGLANYRHFMQEAADLVVSYGGSLSGEHGDGQIRAELLGRMYSAEMIGAFHEFKAIFDPVGRMNPGKMLDPYPLDAYLREGLDYNPPVVKTHFKFPEDHGSFAHAALRCAGVGKCRRVEGGTMCPSFMVTREEEHSTRGRAHALYEMMQGDLLEGGWRDEHVKETLDLCLSCKGCKHECPVSVDMATYKAEFLSHYYQGRLRPRSAYVMGLIYWWARLGSVLPELTNVIAHTPGLRNVVKAIAGIAPERPLPRFAPETFKHWFQRRGPRNLDKPAVIFWADTFCNHFQPEVAIAAVEVLESAGFQVKVPEASLCCGRPLYDYGFLDQAERQLRQVLSTLQSEIEAGVPIVGVEPGCLSVFRDELVNLLPNVENAQRLSKQTFLLSEFLAQAAPEFTWPRVSSKALVHLHCHHKSVLHPEAELEALGRLGLDFEVLDSGCCGMAGSFGYEAGDRHDVSVKAAERVLLPAVRAAAADTLVMTDGFSCREQIGQCSDRQARHLSEVIRDGLRDEGRLAQSPPLRADRRALTLGLMGAGLLAVWALNRRWRP